MKDHDVRPTRVAVIGLGRNARHNHYPVLGDLARTCPIEVAAIVDLASRSDAIRAYLATQPLQPAELIWCPDGQAGADHVPDVVARRLDQIVAEDGLDGIVISTEPRDHQKYLLWAAKAGVRALVDKPLTTQVIDPTAADPAAGLLDDFHEGRSAFAAAGVDATVIVTRRAHAGYEFVRSYIEDLIDEYGVPITYLGAQHSNGVWNMPDEFLHRVNHSYRNGYGALLHAGYHVVDLATWLLAANDRLPVERRAVQLDVSTRHTTPADFYAQVPPHVYERLFGDDDIARLMEGDERGRPEDMGETDATILGQMRDRSGRVITQFAIDMLETAFSRRAWRELPEDHYKGNGRVTHEQVTINVGHLVTMRTYDARRMHAEAPDEPFVVRIYRNSGLIGGQPYEEHRFAATGTPRPGGDAASLADDGRRRLILAWLAGERGPSNIDDHHFTVALTVAAYRSMACQRRGEAPATTMPLPTSDAGTP